jgi:phage antirepressor YoqD-like protein
MFHDVLPTIRKTGMYNVGNLTRLQILEMAVESEKEKIKLEAENKKLRPKAKVYDLVSSSTGLVCISDCAKVLNIRPHAFSAKLKADGYCFVRRGQIVAYEQFIKRGWFEMKLVPARDGSKSTYRQTFITPLGVNKFREIYNPNQRQLRIFA